MYHLIPPVHQVEPNNRIHVGRIIMLVSRYLTCRSTVITFCVEKSLHFALTVLLHFASVLLHFALVLHFAAILIIFCVHFTILITFCGDYYILWRNRRFQIPLA